MVTFKQGSIIDEIRDEIHLDNIYRRVESNYKSADFDFYDDAQSEYDYFFESIE